MHPFDISAVLDPLTEIYPSADVLLRAAKTGDRDVRYAISRLWLSEGIPFAFMTRPSIYEALRIWLARRLDVQAKEITIIGSGRQGYSLSPDKNVGQAFGPHSDLDVTVVSSRMYQSLADAFWRWEHDYTQRVVQPRHVHERSLWDENRRNCPFALERGFFDPHKIPAWPRYPEAQTVLDALWRVHEKLKVTPQAPNVRKVSLRVYRDWDSFVRQMAINLEAVGRITKAVC
ncbi:MAG: hypothetical protein A3H35_08035 [Betaproteobacteria bacterium RIFCSPLOWO2_02_FULL_62_17]|nr:MAG: hypothetical protein A3H35_08035 [Betaproteobacteria bacterium RIFCSPLOWO2_02_FULL_62_17]